MPWGVFYLLAYTLFIVRYTAATWQAPHPPRSFCPDWVQIRLLLACVFYSLYSTVQISSPRLTKAHSTFTITVICFGCFFEVPDHRNNLPAQRQAWPFSKNHLPLYSAGVAFTSPRSWRSRTNETRTRLSAISAALTIKIRWRDEVNASMIVWLKSSCCLINC